MDTPPRYLLIDPVIVREALGLFDAGETVRAVSTKLDINPKTLRKWRSYRDEYGPEWPGHEYDNWHADAERRRIATRATKVSRLRRMKHGPGIVDSTGTVRRLDALAWRGWTAQEIADHGIWEDRQAVAHLRNRPHVLRTTAAAMARIYDDLVTKVGPSLRAAQLAESGGLAPPSAWTPETIDDPEALPIPGATGRISAVGAKRRVRALHRIGWTQDALVIEAQRRNLVGVMSKRQYTDLLESRMILPTQHVNVCRLYEALEMTPGPSPRTVALARNKLWAPPAAWDDDTIDDPRCRAQGTGLSTQRSRLNAEEELDEFLWLLHAGEGWERAATKVGGHRQPASLVKRLDHNFPGWRDEIPPGVHIPRKN